MRDALRWVALAAGLVVSSRFEYAAGVAVGLGAAAYAVPVMVDAYAVGALMAGRDVRAALTLLWASIVTGALHRALTMPDAPAGARGVAGQVALAVAVASLTSGVIWRVDALVHADTVAAETAERDAYARELAQARADLASARADAARAHADAARVRPQPARTQPPRARTRKRAPAPQTELEVRRALRAEWEQSGRTMTGEQIAERLGINDGAARAQLSRWRREPAAVAQ